MERWHAGLASEVVCISGLMLKPMAIEWEDYLRLDGRPLDGATDADIDALEAFLDRELPEDLTELVKKHQGQTPSNLSVELPQGGKRVFTCLLHAIFEPPVPDEIEGYGIDWVTTVTEEELGHENIVAFGDSGNSVYALDYGLDETNPPVVFIDCDRTADDPESKRRLASSVTEFFERFEAGDESGTHD